jgi:hypothetical protein
MEPALQRLKKNKVTGNFEDSDSSAPVTEGKTFQDLWLSETADDPERYVLV